MQLLKLAWGSNTRNRLRRRQSHSFSRRSSFFGVPNGNGVGEVGKIPIMDLVGHHRMVHFCGQEGTTVKKISSDTRKYLKSVYADSKTEPVRVLAGITVYSVLKIDNVNQLVDIDFKVFCQWEDETLIGKDPETVDFSKHFHPHFYVKNAVDLEILEDRQRLKDAELGIVTHTIHYRGTLSQYFRLHSFPFDIQEIKIIISSQGHVIKNYFFLHTGRNSESVASRKSALQEWEVLPMYDPVFILTDRSESSSNVVYSEFLSIVPIRRHCRHYIWSVGSVLSLLVTMCYYTSAISYEKFGDRMIVILSLILTIIAFKYSIYESLPKINYMTLLDKFYFMCFLFMYVMIIGSYVVTNYIDQASAAFVDKTFCDAWFYCWLTFHVLFGCYIGKKTIWYRKIW